MKVNYILSCALVFASVLVIHATTQNATTWDGFEIIHLDYPSFISEFHYDWVTDKFYVYGQGMFRQINHNSKTGFQAIDNTTLVPYDQHFLDVRLFTDNSGKLWTVGPTYNDPNKASSAVGYFFPLTVIGPGLKEDFQGDFRGYTFYAVSLDTRNTSSVLAYFCGWGPGAGSAVDFLVVRARFSLTNFQGMTWDVNKDLVYLHANNYHPYTVTYKPRLIHDFRNNEIFVVSPTFLKIFRLSAPADGVNPMGLLDNLPINGWGALTGQTFHWYNDMLYLGFLPTDHTPATLVEVNLTSFGIINKMYFPVNYTNPRAITGRNNTLYVAFEGGPGIVSVQLGKTMEITGYAKTPCYIRTIYSAWDEGTDHVYFATHEQESKVFRTSKKNFCKAECPEHAYCQNSVCWCAPPYTFSHDKKSCVLNLEGKKISDRGAAVAFGILWAITLVLAAAGWYIVYRARQQGYQRVL